MIDTLQMWDWDEAKMRPPSKNPRGIVSVAFPAEDFYAIAELAERACLPVSTFIRDIAIQYVKEHRTGARISCE